MLEQDPTATILLMPTHQISATGHMTGFRYQCGASQPGNSLPVVRNMFFGHTAVECQVDDATIMSILADQAGAKKK
jgi:hypothetical protein